MGTDNGQETRKERSGKEDITQRTLWECNGHHNETQERGGNR